MSVITILPEHVANQIAAGEVVERPASVVKELLENALDAGAGTIRIEVEEDGTRLVRVIDDGVGMEPDDALLCLERHATSKLRQTDQLMGIRTFGFRGEAIPSIASVSIMTITSRPRAAALGVRVEVRHGRVGKVHETGCGAGTMVEVRNLFGNVPARRKFLKSLRTELTHIEEAVRAAALANPSIGFQLTVNGRAVLDLHPAEDSPETRFRKVFGLTPGQDAIPFGPEAPGGENRVWGFLLPPEEIYGGMGRLRLFVNGRAVHDKVIGHAVNEGLAGFLMKGRRPSGAIFVSVPPDSVDVNVHPAKHEIRFRSASAVHALVRDEVRRGMELQQHRLRERFFGTEAAGPPTPPPSLQESPRPGPNRVEPTARPVRLPLAPAPVPYDTRPMPLPTTGGGAGNTCEVAEGASIPPAHPAPAPHPVAGVDTMEEPPPIECIGQLFDTYLLCQSGRQLLVIDQHAAQERLLFEGMLRQFASGEIPGQALLFPSIIDLDATDVQVVETHGGEIRRLGIDLQPFGGASFVVKTVPAPLAHLSPAEVLRGVLSRFAGGGGRHAAARMEDLIADLACKASVKARRRLSSPEIRHLLDELRKADVFSHCPHGRPVARVFAEDEVRGWFHRG